MASKRTIAFEGGRWVVRDGGRVTAHVGPAYSYVEACRMVRLTPDPAVLAVVRP